MAESGTEQHTGVGSNVGERIDLEEPLVAPEDVERYDVSVH